MSPPAPIHEAAVTPSPHSGSTSTPSAAPSARPVFQWNREVSAQPSEPVSYADAPPSIGTFVPGGVGTVGALPIITPALPPPPKPETHPATQSAPIRVGGSVQMAKLIRKVLPVYPALARTARISGVVHLMGIIGKDGTIRDLQLIGGHPMLAHAAMEAVEQWIYEPTLLNGEPVEVIAPIEVKFTLGQ